MQIECADISEACRKICEDLGHENTGSMGAQLDMAAIKVGEVTYYGSVQLTHHLLPGRVYEVCPEL